MSENLNRYDFSDPPTTLDVTLYGAMEKFSDVLSKCRVRIFYKGMNRNRTFISEDFANQLISSLPYTPVKGIFNKDSVDFEDHGEDNSEGRIYGIVPENPNFSWEKHEDEDGVIREYASCDVLLFTGIYHEATLIPDKPQSMEIYRKTLKGEWRLSEEDGKPYYYFIKGGLVGLQTLGEDVEPCFEGSAFYSKLTEDQLIEIMTVYVRNFTRKKEENKKMDKSLFRLSDNEKADILFDLVNPNFNEEGNWELSAFICEVYDDYALCRGKDGFTRAYYTKDGDNVTLGEIVPVKITDVTEAEFTALEAMKAAGDMLYEGIGVEINESEAVEFYLKAGGFTPIEDEPFFDRDDAGLDDEDMFNRLGLSYFYEYDYERAAYFFILGAEEFDSVNCMGNAGITYESAMDWENAYKWYNAAIEAGHPDSERFEKKVKQMEDEGLV